jgi:glycosyltransferase involved in cell wall biosynthesis
VQHVRNVVRHPEKNYGYQVAERIICNSNSTAAVFHDVPAFAPKTVTLYNAVDLSRYESEADTRRRELDIPESRPVVGFVGQLVPRKGVTTLISALPAVLREVPDALLVIVGCAPPDETSYEAECRTLVTDLGLDNHVKFVGYRKDVPAFMRTFDVFALPTRSEPFGKVVIEAMAAECPVVASRVGGIPEIITSDELGTLIAPDDNAALAAALIPYLTSPERRRQVAARGAASARSRFGMPSMLQQLQGLYDEVLSGQAAIRPTRMPADERRRGAA